jgi:hypothetical protein
MSEASEQAVDVRALGEAIKATTAALDRMGDTAGQTRDAVNGLGDKFSSARSTVMEVVGAVMEFGRAMQDAAVATARQGRALELLGTDYAQVERQTMGLVSAQEALEARGRLTNSGLRVTGEQLGLLTRAAREYAQSTGTEVTQALEQLTDAVGEASEDGLRKFNLRLNEGVPRQDAFNSSLEQLRQRFAGTAPAALAADERVAAFNRTAGETKDLLMAQVSSVGNTLLGALFSIGSVFGGGIGANESPTEVLRQFNQELRDAGGLFSLGLNNVEQAAARAREQMANVERVNREFIAQRGAFEASETYRAAGLRLESARNLTNEQKRLLVELFAESERLSTADFVRRANDITNLANMQRAAAQQSAELARINAAAEAAATADRLAHSRDDLAMAIRTAQQAGQRNFLTTQAVTPMQRLAFLQRELGRLSQDEVTNRAQIVTTLNEITQIRQQQQQQAEQANATLQQQVVEKFRLMDAETQLRNLRATMAAEGAIEAELEQRRFESTIDFRNREIEAARRAIEATRAARTQEQADFDAYLARQRELTDEYDRQERAKSAAAAAQAAAAFALQREDELVNRLRESFGLAGDAVTTYNQQVATAAKTGTDAVGELVNGSIEAAVSAAQAGEEAGAAIAKYVDEWTASKALQWGLQALEAVAGAGVAYFIRPDAVPGLLASAATYAGLAAAAGVATAAIPNAPAEGAGAGTEGAGRGERMAGSSRFESAAASAPVAPIVFNVSGFTSTESAQEGIVRALREAQARGLIEMGR